MRCGKCGECFASQAELITHRATHTKKQTAQPLLNFSCQLCNKGFPTQIKFFEHLKAHYEPIPKLEDEDEQQPELQQLQDDNVHNTELEEHLESKMTLPTVIVHELPPALPPPLACPHCNKVFRRQKAFDSHISTAHGHIQVYNYFFRVCEFSITKVCLKRPQDILYFIVNSKKKKNEIWQPFMKFKVELCNLK